MTNASPRPGQDSEHPAAEERTRDEYADDLDSADTAEEINRKGGKMVVTDAHVTAFKAWLNGDAELAKQLLTSDDRATRRGYVLLISGVYVSLAFERFDQATLDDVIDYVADLRTRAPWMVDELDPVVAERLLLEIARDSDTPTDVEPWHRFATQHRLTGELACDRELAEGELDRLLADAQASANRWAREKAAEGSHHASR